MRTRTSEIVVRIGLAAVFAGLLPASASGWWNNAWGLRRKITFDNSGQPSNLADFPVLVRLDGTRVEYFRTQDLGEDIRFVDADDATVLDHETELWNEAGTSYVWVRVPQINAGSTTDYIWMYYDNPTVLDGQNAAGVWSNGYRGVWHLKEDPAGAPPQMKDSANTNHGTAENSPVQAAGQIDGSLAFVPNVLEQNVNVPNSASLQLPTNMTVSAWVRTTNGDVQPRIVVAKWNSTGSALNYWFGKLNASTFNFYVDATQNVGIGLGLVNDGLWHYVVGVADSSAGLLRLYVDGTQQATAPYSGTSQTGTSELRIGKNPDTALQLWAGGIDEVRVAGVARSADWLRAQNLSMRDTFATFDPAACFSGCQALAVTDSGSSITVTSANAFELVFSDAAGGHVDQFFDLDEDPTRTYDLAGGLASQDGLFLDEIGWAFDTNNYRSDKSSNGGRGAARLLEVSSARVLVRSESYFGLPGGGTILPGVKGYGDWSVYASGRLALNWKRVTTSAVDTTFDQLHLNLRRPAAGPLSGWAGFTQSGPLCFTSCTGPAGDDFVMVQNETAGAPGVRTDFLMIQYSDWPSATSTWGGESVGNEWIEDSWMRSAPLTLPADGTESWNFLTHFKPTTFTSHADAAVTSRRADYRLPDDLASPAAPVAGSGWFDAAESTASPSDFFNEKEAAYALDLDPVAGLNFDLDGGTTTRYHPFFKIRQWRSLAAPNALTLEGVTLTWGVGFKADVMPISRSSMHRNLLWRSSLQSLAAITGPDVGSAGSVSGAVSYEPARFGSGARVSASGDSIQVPTTGNFDPARGVLGFWYRPTYDSNDGVLHDIAGFFFDASNYWLFEKRGAADSNELWFRINSGGALSIYRITAANYAWRANEWVHLTLDWDDSAALGGQQRIEINDVEPSHIDSGVDYNSATLTLAAQFGFGNSDGDATFAPGVYDEIEIVRAHPLLAAAGLIGDSSEFLADPAPAQNFTLNFLPVDASRRGRYLYLGATSKFRGLNVALATPGVGVPADALEWEYWDGTEWTSLETVAGFTDTTNSLTRTGNVYWTADPPGWAPFSIFGGVDIFRIRVHLAAGSSYSTFPVEAIIKTDVLLLQYCGDITLDAQTFGIAPPIPTAVSLESFSATPRDSAVDLSWTTASELQNLGFHLRRAAAAAGPWERITTSLIPGLGSSPAGASYAYRDTGLSNGKTYFYLLEDVETTGRTKRHGPVSATPSAEAGGATRPSDEVSASVMTYGRPEATAIRVVSRGPTQVVLELATEGFYAFPRENGTVRIEVPGLVPAEDALGLPVARHWLDAVAGRKVEILSVRASRVETLEVRPAASETRELVASWDGTQRLRRSRASNRLEQTGPLVPEREARIASVAFQGEVKKALVEMAPLRWDDSSGRLVLARTLVVTVGFRGREPSELVSHDGRRGRRERKTDTTRGVVARFSTRERGLYEVRFEDVFGRRSTGVLASTLRLSRLGRAAAFHIEPASDRFALGSTLFFMSEGADANPYGTEAVYELELGAARPLLMPIERAAAGDRTLRHYRASASFEKQRYYQAALLEAEDIWLWDMILSGSVKPFSFSVGSPEDSAGRANLEVFLQGGSDFPESPDHHVRIHLNGTLVGEDAWNGKESRKLAIELPKGVLGAGDNRLEIENVGDTRASYSMVFLDRFTVSYPRLAVAENGLLEGTWSESGAAEVTSIGSSARVLDVTAETPRWLDVARSRTDELRFPVEAGHSYMVVDPASVMRPVVRKASRSRWKQPGHRADYVAIGPRELLQAAKPLLAFRRGQGLEIASVPIDDLFDEMGYGERRPEAVHDFLSYAYHHWQGGIRFVLLLGDASYDFKNHLGTGAPNLVPALPLRTSYVWTASDPALAAVNGDDLLPDVAIGRLPAADARELGIIVEKILAYETGAGLRGPVVLITDDPDAAGDFDSDARDLMSSVLASRPARHISLSALGVPETRKAILEGFDQGASSVSYMGHGGIHLWASENLFDNDSIGLLARNAQNPVVLALDCLNGYFHFPFFDSLGEELLKAEGKGAIAVIAPSGLSLNDPAHRLHKALLEELSSPRNRTLGEAVAKAQERFLETGSFAELLSIYHLFSDPALTLR